MRLEVRAWSQVDPPPEGSEFGRADHASSPDDLDDEGLLAACMAGSIGATLAARAAAALLQRFGSLSGVLGASVEALATTPGMTLCAAEDLRRAQELAVRLAKAQIAPRSIISSWTALLSYVGLKLRHQRQEQFRVLFLDVRNQLIRDEVLGSGTVDHAPVYPREVIRRALELSASNLILVHNHPGGDPTPSRADIDMTKQIIEAGRLLKIAVHDHLVVGRDGVASFKSLGLL